MAARQTGHVGSAYRRTGDPTVFRGVGGERTGKDRREGAPGVLHGFSLRGVHRRSRGAGSGCIRVQRVLLGEGRRDGASGRRGKLFPGGRPRVLRRTVHFRGGAFRGLSVGLDIDFGKVSAAAGIQRKRIVAYERRERGRTFRPVEGAYDPPRNVLFLVGDALDPPFPGESFDLVGALNLLDNVRVPLTLLGQADALLGTGGFLILGTPYEWRAEIADPAEWLETDALDAAALLREIVEGTAVDRLGFRYSVESEVGGLAWTLRGHSRRRTIFLSHVMRARKNGTSGCEAA